MVEAFLLAGPLYASRWPRRRPCRPTPHAGGDVKDAFRHSTGWLSEVPYGATHLAVA